jgi:hypothetical protein
MALDYMDHLFAKPTQWLNKQYSIPLEMLNTLYNIQAWELVPHERIRNRGPTRGYTADPKGLFSPHR